MKLKAKYNLVKKIDSNEKFLFYIAKDKDDNEFLAVLLRNDIIKNDPKKFLEEVKLTASFSHPNLFEILDYGQFKSTVFFVTFPIQAINLEETLASNKTFSPLVALRIIEQLVNLSIFLMEENIKNFNFLLEDIFIDENFDVKILKITIDEEKSEEELSVGLAFIFANILYKLLTGKEIDRIKDFSKQEIEKELKDLGSLKIKLAKILFNGINAKYNSLQTLKNDLDSLSDTVDKKVITANFDKLKMFGSSHDIDEEPNNVQKPASKPVKSTKIQTQKKEEKTSTQNNSTTNTQINKWWIWAIGLAITLLLFLLSFTF